MSPIDEEELDRLADYAAGLLDAATAGRVRERVATDPDWAGAYADLVAAGPRLDAVLSDLRDPPVPADVADRLSAALAGERGPARTRTTVVDLASRRRWTRAATMLTAAAAVLVIVLGGVVALSTLRPQQGTNSAGSAARAPAPQSIGALDSTAGLTVQHSGTNYSAQTLPGVGRAPAGAAPAPNPSPLNGQGNKADSQAAPPADVIGLQRLYDSGALQQCLDALRTRYGGEPTLVDYARWQGIPALVVVLSLGGVRRIVVVGPSCGLPGTGTDERYSTLG